MQSEILAQYGLFAFPKTKLIPVFPESKLQKFKIEKRPGTEAAAEEEEIIEMFKKVVAAFQAAAVALLHRKRKVFELT